MIPARPQSVNILGVTYTITYVQAASEVDVFKRKSLMGQIDGWTRTIRLHEADRPTEDILQTLMHEIVHGIAHELHLQVEAGGIDMEGKNEDSIDALVITLADTLFRNGWLQVT